MTPLIRTSNVIERAPYVAAGGTGIVAFGFPLNDLALIFSMVIAFSTFLVSWYYKRRSDRREEEYYKRGEGLSGGERAEWAKRAADADSES